MKQLLLLVAPVSFLLSVAPPAPASENVPHRPFAMWADVPEAGQFILGLIYEESEAYHIWANRTIHNVTAHANGEEYGIDINQGYFALQYGLAKKWTADLNVGATTMGWRYFDPDGAVRSTTGLMDLSFGLRYQAFNEATAEQPWIPTVTFRAGGILPGTYSKSIAFAPGTRSAAIEPEVLLRKHFGWPGLGMYFDGLFRWNRTTHNDQYITDAGFFQQIKGWELDLGYRHLQSITGSDIVLNEDRSIIYPRDVREISDTIAFGFSYTTSTKHLRWAFNGRTVVDGSNTDGKFWVGGSLDIPFGGTK